MSSHHIVRDEQEPALLLHEFSQPHVAFVSQLLGWSPTVMALPNALDCYVASGLKVDVCLCKNNQREEISNLVASQSPVQLITVRERSYLEVAFEYFFEKHHHAVNVVTNQSAIIPLFEQLSQVISKEKVDVVLYDEGAKYVVVQAKPFAKWLQDKEQIEIWMVSLEQIEIDGFEVIGSSLQGISLVKSGDGIGVVKPFDKKLFLVKQFL